MDINCEDFWDETFRIDDLCEFAEKKRLEGFDVSVWKHKNSGFLLASSYAINNLQPWSDCHTVTPRYYATCREALERWKGIHIP